MAIKQRFERLWLYFFISATIPLLATDTTTYFSTQTNQTMQLWILVNQLVRTVPFTRQRVADVLDMTLTLRSDNEYMTQYRGKRMLLADDVIIIDVDLRVAKPEHPHPGFLIIYTGGTCVTLKNIKEQYPVVNLTDIPRGRSDDEKTTYTAINDWGKLHFMFTQQTEDCLAGISLEPTKKH